ncbi:flagellar biosynthesis protein FlhB [Elioraea rosea]|uniref:flagellar biosynthesis protein FlhB n=1 Tax=Elioraea rosea TaxID=2492390 RepID=UPI001182DC9C|nr:flagellar biosynthesis protein FlhB [Elioraea rosea]
MAEETPGDKTEAPTPRRLEKAREEGQVAVSKEVSGAIGMASAIAGITLLLPYASAHLVRNASVLLEQSAQLAGPFPDAAWRTLLWGALVVLAVIALPMLLAPAATLMQTRGMVSAKLVTPQLSRLSPLAGIKRLFSATNLVEFLKNLAKLGVLCAVAALVLGGMTWQLMPAASWHTGQLLAALREDSLLLLGTLAAVFAAIAVLDFAWVRFDHQRKLRMSREDLKEEMKQTDGDPEIRARLKRIRVERSRNRMMSAIAKADVIITNPTHYAVALQYERGGTGAPKVVAKGVDHMAARIRAAAEKHGIPLVANPPLARALYTVELDREIPPEHYEAVAEIIAYVWRLRGQAGFGAAHAGG